MRELLQVGGLIVVAPSLAHAHGEEVFFVPIGWFVALIVVVFIAWCSSKNWSGRWVVFLSAIAVAIVVAFLPGTTFPNSVRYTAIGNFLIGLLPPIIMAVLTSIGFALRSKYRHGT